MIKKIMVFCVIISFLGCLDAPQNSDCLPSIDVSISTDLNNPSLINVQTPGGFAYIQGGQKGILLFNINNTRFVAFDRLCPNTDCTAPMVFENGLTLRCTCDDSKYSVHFQGAPQTDNTKCPAREYKVTKIGTSLRITNF